MFRVYFKYFQFIVVFLKDGMFNNVNVFFKMKFVDGVFMVMWYVQFQFFWDGWDEDGSGVLGRGGIVKKNFSKRLRIDIFV